METFDELASYHYLGSQKYSSRKKAEAKAKYSEAFKALKTEYKEEADNYLANGDNIKAAIYYMKAGEIAAAKDAYDITAKVGAGWNSSLAIANDGTVQYAVGGERTLSGDAISGINVISYFGKEGNDGFTGLTADGKVVTENPSGMSIYYSKKVKTWTELKQFIGNGMMGFGLKRDGKVVFDSNVSAFPAGLDQWTDIIEIGGTFSVNWWKLWGIDSSGYLHSTGIEGAASFSECVIKKFVTNDVIVEMVALNQAGEINRSIPSNYIIRSEIERNNGITDILLKNNCLVCLTEEALNSDEGEKWFHALGVKSDGSLVSLTDGDYAEVSDWKLW